MQPIEKAAATTTGWKTPEAKSVLICSDLFESQEGCCRDCHERNYYLVLYPWSIYSSNYRDKMPDLGMGLRAEVCCARFHAVRELPREWWIKLYAKKNGWSEAEGEELARSTPENYFKIWNNVAGRRESGVVSKSAGRTTVKSSPRPKSPTTCPQCGAKWRGFVCDACGYAE